LDKWIGKKLICSELLQIMKKPSPSSDEGLSEALIVVWSQFTALRYVLIRNNAPKVM